MRFSESVRNSRDIRAYLCSLQYRVDHLYKQKTAETRRLRPFRQRAGRDVPKLLVLHRFDVFGGEVQLCRRIVETDRRLLIDHLVTFAEGNHPWRDGGLESLVIEQTESFIRRAEELGLFQDGQHVIKTEVAEFASQGHGRLAFLVTQLILGLTGQSAAKLNVELIEGVNQSTSCCLAALSLN